MSAERSGINGNKYLSSLMNDISTSIFTNTSKPFINAFKDIGGAVCAKGRNTALYIASGRGSQDIVKFLLENDVTPNTINDNNISPLCIAIARGNRAIVDMLAYYTPNVSIMINDRNNFSILHILASDGYNEALDKVLKYSNVDILNNEGITPLMAAAVNSTNETVLQFINAGSDVNITPPDAKSILELIAIKSKSGPEQIEKIKILVAAGAAMDGKTYTSLDINIQIGLFKQDPIGYVNRSQLSEYIKESVKEKIGQQAPESYSAKLRRERSCSDAEDKRICRI